MHYCQSCPTAVRLEPDDDDAVCPACGYREPAPRAPLFLVTGASGSGKTVLAPLVARDLAGRAVTFDADLLIDAAGEMAGGDPIVWSGFWAGWLAAAHGVAASGLPTVVLGPLRPNGLEEQPSRRWVGPVHVLLLDCPDDERRRRIERRPVWRSRDTDQQIEFGRWLRAQVSEQIDTSAVDAATAAAEVAAWVRAKLNEECETKSATRRVRHEECDTKSATRRVRHEECDTKSARRREREEDSEVRAMASRFYQLVVDAREPGELARFWAAVLGVEVIYDAGYEVIIGTGIHDYPGISFLQNTDEKAGKNRLHIDLDPDDQEAEIERIVALGARRADIGQDPDATWTVLFDPEGNEFCVLRPHNSLVD